MYKSHRSIFKFVAILLRENVKLEVYYPVNLHRLISKLIIKFCPRHIIPRARSMSLSILASTILRKKPLWMSILFCNCSHHGCQLILQLGILLYEIWLGLLQILEPCLDLLHNLCPVGCECLFISRQLHDVGC